MTGEMFTTEDLTNHLNWLVDEYADETCAETEDGKALCGQPATEQVEWDMHPDGVRRPQAPVTRQVCTEHADALMGWAATHLSPRRTALV